ncbi:hypothetical protein ANN_00893 [Periplaneta americana]|uniref:Uncharacterized protein n=1 Tax=Periplaneta americana TaxID=6978 RepID=A0ABQ8TUG7_PERAM|nr:hypothetical protein ANN_00893 [Periplaneta americana]
MDLRKVGYDDRDWINLAQDLWRAYKQESLPQAVRILLNEPEIEVLNKGYREGGGEEEKKKKKKMKEEEEEEEEGGGGEGGGGEEKKKKKKKKKKEENRNLKKALMRR